MSIDINKELDSYTQLTANKRGRESFTATDIIAIYEDAENDRGIDISMAIMKALAVGYSVGYKTAKRDMRERS